jgi:membrane protein implicated in regulation of membrane protease activity
MVILTFLLILALLAVMGILGFVLKVAFAVALGVFLGFLLLAAVAWWRVRRALFGPRSRTRRLGRSSVEVMDHQGSWVHRRDS